MRITTFFNHETLMNQVTLLRDALRPHLAWHGARLSFLAAFLIALLRVKTVNFSELATSFSGKAQTESHYKRLQRFFRHYEMDYAEIAQGVVTLMAIPEPWVLSIVCFAVPEGSSHRMAVWRVHLQYLNVGRGA